MADLIKTLTAQYMKPELPTMNVGDTVRVTVRVKDGNRERNQAFEGVIIAKRHIHFTPEEAAAANVSDKEIVKVKVTSERTTIFEDVVVRVSPSFKGAMHIDTDEANASCAFGVCYGEIVK